MSNIRQYSRVWVSAILRNPYVMPSAIAFAGFLVSYLIYLHAVEWQKARIETEFQSLANERISAFRSQITLNLEKIKSIVAFYAASQDVSRGSFNKFVKPLTDGDSAAQAFEWIPYVKDSQRLECEISAQNDGYANFHITERDSHGQLQVAKEREIYFPVYYVEPYKGNELALGFDLASNLTRLEALKASCDTGQYVATARIKLVQEQKDQFGFLIFHPLYNDDAAHQTPEQRRDSLKGFVLGAFLVGDMFEGSIKYSKPIGLDVHIFDETAPLDERFLYFHSSRMRTNSIKPLTYQDALNAPSFKNMTHIDVCGRKWLIVTTPGPGFIAAAKTSQPLQLMLTGFCITLFIVVCVRLIQTYTVRIRGINVELKKEIVEHKHIADALSESENKYRTLFDNANDSISIVNEDGIFIDCNNKALEMLACTREQFLGQSPCRFSAPTQPDGTDSQQKALRIIKAALQGERQISEWMHVKYDGTPFYGEVSLSAIELNGKRCVQAIVRNITARKQALNVIKRSEETLRQILDSVAFGVMIIGKDKKIRHVNKVAAKMADYASTEEMQGVICHQNLCPAQMGNCPIFDMNQQVNQSERVLLTSSGKEIPIFKSVVPIVLNGEEVLLESFVDITNLKKAQEATRKAKDEWEDTFNSINDIVTIHDSNFNIVLANKAAQTAFGLSIQALIGKKCYQLYHHTACPPEGCASCMVNKTGVPMISEFYEPALNCHVEVKAFPRFDEKKNIIGVVHVVRDITERKRAQEELSKNRSMLANILNSVPQSIFWKDRNNVFQGCNEVFAQTTGVGSPEKIIGMTDFDILPREVAETYRAIDRQVMECNKPMHHVVDQIKKENGTLLWLDISRMPLLDETGSVYGILGVFEDITERKQAEETLRKANEQLIGQDKLKSELIDTITHELRTPLCIFRNIISNAVVGALGKISPKLRENLTVADAEINRLARIISDFADVSQIDEGKIELCIKHFAMQSVISKAIKSLMPLAMAKNIQLIIAAPDDELLVDADFGRIVHVLTDLIDNAIKFTPENGQITVRAKGLENEVGVEVEDTGMGIAADDISKVFTRFTQIEKIVGPGQHGTGLGLSISKSIIEMHGGRIWVESTLGQGSIFCFTLPKLRQPNTTDEELKRLSRVCNS